MGLEYLFGSLPLDGGPFALWWRFNRHHNHAQFSPTDPNTVYAIVTATGIASRQGAFGAELRPTSEDLVPENGVLTFDFVVAYPEYRTSTGSEQSRRVVVGYDLSRQDLEGVRSIRVVGQTNALESRQR